MLHLLSSLARVSFFISLVFVLFFIWLFHFIDFLFDVIGFYRLLAHYAFLLLDFNFFSVSLISFYTSSTRSFLTLARCDFETFAITLS